ncbi:hypothetical protein [Microtetraspora malaysiensis]|uniref:Uncharacterized protein n=1 Tax=Microtetraspora malaysiensis TaxID=161358 RepID=A0ABW6SWJ0_9ACTN
MSACAVTIKTANLGERTKIWVALDVQNAGVVKNEELTTDHTVPIYHYAPRRTLVPGVVDISTTPEAFRRSGYG